MRLGLLKKKEYDNKALEIVKCLIEENVDKEYFLIAVSICCVFTTLGLRLTIIAHFFHIPLAIFDNGNIDGIDDYYLQ